MFLKRSTLIVGWYFRSIKGMCIHPSCDVITRRVASGNRFEAKEFPFFFSVVYIIQTTRYSWLIRAIIHRAVIFLPDFGASFVLFAHHIIGSVFLGSGRIVETVVNRILPSLGILPSASSSIVHSTSIHSGRAI